MSARLAMVACMDKYPGVWANARGNEGSVEVLGLGRGEYIRLEMDTGNEESYSVEFYQAGSYPWPNLPASRYRFSKFVCSNDPRCATTVRIHLLVGKAQ